MWDILWWHWMVAGLVILAVDVLLINTFYMLWFGISGVAVALLLAVFPSLPVWGQILLFGVLSLGLLALWLLILRPRYTQKNIQKARHELPGLTAIVVHYNTHEKIGTIRLQKPVGGRDVWQFSATHTPQAGDRVTVGSVDDSGTVMLNAPNS